MDRSQLTLKNGNSLIFYAVLVATSFMIQGAPTQVSPHIATFQQMFSDHSLSTIMYLATIPNLVCVPLSFAVGAMVKKMGLKSTLLIGLFAFLIGGFLPLVHSSSLGWLLFCRFIGGCGYGILYSLVVTLVSAIYKEGQLRQTMMGVGTCFQCIGVVLFSFLTGFLVSRLGSLNGVWLGTVIMIPATVLALFAKLPRGVADELEEQIVAAEDAKAAEKAARAAGKPVVREKLNGYVWFLLIAMFVCGLIYNEIFIYISNVIVDNNLGNTFDVAGVVSAHAIVAAIIAPTYGVMYKFFGKRVPLIIGAILCLVSCVLMATAHSLITVYISACMHHAFFGWMFSAICMLLAQTCPPQRLSGVNGWLIAFFNAGAFCTGNVMIALTGLFGRQDDLRFAFWFAAVGYAALAIVYFVVRPKVDYTKNNNEPAEAAN